VTRAQILEISLESTEIEVVEIGAQGPAGPPGSAGATYRATFGQSNLSSAGVLSVAHNLGLPPIAVTVIDAQGEIREPDFVKILSADTIEIGIESFTPISGSWQVLISA